MWERRLRPGVLVLVLLLVLSVFLLRHFIPGIHDVREFVGYPGVFLLSFLASASILVPIPGVAAICLGGVFLFPPAVALLAGIAEAIGELSGYGIGYSGRVLVETRWFYPVASRWMIKRGTLALFLASIIPNPIFDVLGVLAGGLRFPLLRFFLIVWAGKTIKSFGIVYACYFSADLASQVFRWFSF